MQIACLWFAVTSVSRNSKGTPADSGSHEEGSSYVNSIYWGVTTLLSVGYGDIVPEDQVTLTVTLHRTRKQLLQAQTQIHPRIRVRLPQGERAVAMTAMVAGTIGVGYVLASVAAALANADFARTRYQEQVPSPSWF